MRAGFIVSARSQMPLPIRKDHAGARGREGSFGPFPVVKGRFMPHALYTRIRPAPEFVHTFFRARFRRADAFSQR